MSHKLNDNLSICEIRSVRFATDARSTEFGLRLDCVQALKLRLKSVPTLVIAALPRRTVCTTAALFCTLPVDTIHSIGHRSRERAAQT